MYLFHFLQVLQVFMLVDQRFYVIHDVKPYNYMI